jgi:hypothetical protein
MPVKPKYRVLYAEYKVNERARYAKKRGEKYRSHEQRRDFWRKVDWTMTDVELVDVTGRSITTIRNERKRARKHTIK